MGPSLCGLKLRWTLGLKNRFGSLTYHSFCLYCNIIAWFFISNIATGFLYKILYLKNFQHDIFNSTFISIFLNDIYGYGFIFFLASTFFFLGISTLKTKQFFNVVFLKCTLEALRIINKIFIFNFAQFGHQKQYNLNTRVKHDICSNMIVMF